LSDKVLTNAIYTNSGTSINSGLLNAKSLKISSSQIYIQLVRRYILFHDKRHPKEMGRVKIESFLTDLAVMGNVAASTQNHAFYALMFYTAMSSTSNSMLLPKL